VNDAMRAENALTGIAGKRPAYESLRRWRSRFAGSFPGAGKTVSDHA
jgi:hypothetical protein